MSIHHLSNHQLSIPELSAVAYDIHPTLVTGPGGLVAVPSERVGVCPTCRSSADPGRQRCFSCARRWRGLPRVVPASLSVHGGYLHALLRGYKDDLWPHHRRDCSTMLAEVVDAFLARHRACLGAFDLVVPVPSARRCAPGEIAWRCREVPDVREVLRVEGDDFVVDWHLAGERVLVFDDTFTTGASVAGATQALRHAGAIVETALVIGRHVNPTWVPTARLLERQRNVAWSRDSCCVCADAVGSQAEAA